MRHLTVFYILSGLSLYRLDAGLFGRKDVALSLLTDTVVGRGARVDNVDVLGNGLFGQKVTNEINIFLVSCSLFHRLHSIPLTHHHIIMTYLWNQVYIIFWFLLLPFPYHQLPQNSLNLR